MPVFNTIPPETQEQLILMANTDIRSMLAAVEAATAQGTTNAATIATQGVTLADVKATAVVEKNFTLQKVAFILEGAVYRAPIQHDMGSRFPGVTIYDNDGDLQLAEFIALSDTLCKLELTASQWADNSFPLTVNLQARNSATVAQPASGEIVAPGSNFKLRLKTQPGGFKFIQRATVGMSDWVDLRTDQFIAAARVGANGRIDALLADGNTYVATDLQGANWLGSNVIWFDGLGANGANDLIPSVL